MVSAEHLDNVDESKPEIDVRALLAEIQTGALKIRAVGPKIFEVSRPGIPALVCIAELVYDSHDFIAKEAGTRSLVCW